MALAGVSTGFILFMLGSPGPLMTVVVVAAIFAGLLYVMSRPS